MQLIIFTGLPGTGKSTVASAIAQRLKIPLFAKDKLEHTLRQSGIEYPASAYASYELLTMLAREQFNARQSAMLDSVASPTKLRETWLALAQEYHADVRVIRCICSDEAVHRQRIAARDHWQPFTWEDVEKVKRYFVEWDISALTLDAIRPPEENIAAAVAYLQIEPRNSSNDI
jgi:predicted kinase